MRPIRLQELLYHVGAVRMSQEKTEENLMANYPAFLAEQHPHVDASLYICPTTHGGADLFVRFSQDLISYPGLSYQTLSELRLEILQDVQEQIQTLWNS